MTEQTRKRIVFGFLGLALVYGAFNIEWSEWSRQGATPARESGSVGMPVQVQQSPVVLNMDSILSTPWGPDPFRLHSNAAEPASEEMNSGRWRLSGIVYSPEKPMAIINARPVGIGDSIDDASVIEIKHTSVTLQRGDKRFTLSVNGG